MTSRSWAAKPDHGVSMRRPVAVIEVKRAIRAAAIFALACAPAFGCLTVLGMAVRL